LSAIADLIEEGGLRAVNAREVARRVGVAVGSVYLVHGSLDAAISAANGRTLARIDAAMGVAVEEATRSGGDAVACCLALGRCYARFARDHRQAWAALFEFTPEDRGLLSVHHAVLAGMVGRIVQELARLSPQTPVEELAVRARTFFGAVHGVVHTALEGWFFGTPADRLEAEVDVLVHALVGAVHA
jgi:AcrR family transcriptional regulator